jgi:hypothetical protein
MKAARDQMNAVLPPCEYWLISYRIRNKRAQKAREQKENTFNQIPRPVKITFRLK